MEPSGRVALLRAGLALAVLGAVTGARSHIRRLSFGAGLKQIRTVRCILICALCSGIYKTIILYKRHFIGPL
jgi:hypothetical protein